MIKWEATKEEIEIISKIADRAVDMFKKIGVDQKKMLVFMDIEATHCNGCPLALKEMLEADDMNFAHDIGGIYRHINRQTGELEDCFMPRYAAVYHQKAEAL